MPNPYYKQHWIDVEPHRHAAYDKILAFHLALEPLIRPLELKRGLRVLDVGSGPGHTTMELARRVGSSGRVTGVDINAEFVAGAATRAREGGIEVEFIRSEFPPLPFPSSSFDRVFCKNVLEYVDSAVSTVVEMARVAAKGAIVVAIDSDWDMLALDLPAAARERSDRAIAAAIGRGQGAQDWSYASWTLPRSGVSRHQDGGLRRRRHKRARSTDAEGQPRSICSGLRPSHQRRG
jgi:SAM-dependent methyltransferase